MTNNIDSVQVLDLETSIKNRGEGAIGKMKASPHCPKNKIVWYGALNSQTGEHGTRKCPASADGTDVGFTPEVIVGQNVKFDLLYLMRSKKFRNEQLPKIRIWDTMLAEYLLTGQQSRMTNLDTLATKYGGEVKDDRLKEMWEAGVDTEDIDSDIIQPYLVGDLQNTDIVFKAQVKQANELGMMPLIKSQMDALLATTEMEFNGMYFDKVSATMDSILLSAQITGIEFYLVDFMDRHLPHLDMADITPKSANQVSLALFGGEAKVKHAVPLCNVVGEELLYKTGPRKGKPRTRLEERTERVSGASVSLRFTKETKKKSIYQVNDEVLHEIQKEFMYDIGEFARNLLKYRELTKDLSTYYVGYSELVWPHDSCIHPNYNHCVTATGRLSHSAPNLGNVSHKK